MKIWVSDRNSIFKDFGKEFEIVKEIGDADAVLLWNDVYPFERSIIDLARSLGKKTAVVQHGRRGSSRYYPPFNEPIYADMMFVWGESDKERLVKAGHDAKKIHVVGTRVLADLPEKKEHKDIHVVFSPEHWDRPVEENMLVRDELRKLKGIKITTKILDSHNAEDFDNPLQTDRNSDEHLSTCKELLSTADLLVGISESTLELIAQSMDIPVVIVEDWTPKSFGGDERYVTYERIISSASKRTTLGNLRKTIADQLANKEELREARSTVAKVDGGIHLDTLKLIKKCLT